MPIDEKLLQKARETPGGVRFDDACKLAVQLGFEFARQEGSHSIYQHSRGAELREQFQRPLNLQEGKNGQAKAYQVRQMLQMAEALGIIEREEKES